MRYLDPRADLTFKKVFGEHPDILISFLNALLPLAEDEQIVSIEYLSSEMLPVSENMKYSLVDVSCKDAKQRQFIVEMQMSWFEDFKKRVLFNASKAYVRQLGKGNNYRLLMPVYSLNLLNENFEHKLKSAYHHYRIVHAEHSDKVIDGLQFIFIELPKFEPQNFKQKKLRALWLRFLTEMGERKELPTELLTVPEIKKAVDILQEGAFTEEEMRSYDKFWDAVSTEKSKMSYSKEVGMAEGRAEGLEKGLEKGLEIGLEKGKAEGIEKTSRAMKANNIPAETIALCTGLSLDEIANLN